MILSYSPWRAALGADYADAKVLLVGDPREKVLEVAESYGLRGAVHYADYATIHETINPFRQVALTVAPLPPSARARALRCTARGAPTHRLGRNRAARRLHRQGHHIRRWPTPRRPIPTAPRHATPQSAPKPTTTLRSHSRRCSSCATRTIGSRRFRRAEPTGGSPAAHRVRHDPPVRPRAQVIVDILCSPQPTLREYDAAAPTIPVHFSNPDVLWKAQHPFPRFGQGAFKIALRALYLTRLRALRVPEETHVRIHPH